MKATNDQPWNDKRHQILLEGVRITCGLATFLAVMSSLHLFTFYRLNTGLDPSWNAALGTASSRHDLFGVNIIFTGGPLSSIYTRYYDRDLWSIVLCFGLLTGLGISIAAYLTARNLLAATILPILLLLAPSDSIMLFAPVLMATSLLAETRVRIAALLIFTLSSAALSLTKFTVFPIALIGFAVLDTFDLCRHRAPLGVVFFMLATTAIFVTLQSPGGSLGSFLYYSAQTSIGYAGAMSLNGSRRELIYFVAESIALFGSIVFSIWKRGFRQSADLIFTSVIIGPFLFLAFKQGFVRHDLHSLFAWSAICLAVPLVVRSSPDRWLAGASLVCLGLSLYETNSVRVRASTPGVLSAMQSGLIEIPRQLASVRDLGLDRPSWVRVQEEQARQSAEAVRSADPLPALNGTVDVLPSIQSSVIAAGMSYKPRFTIQEYTSYTPVLIQKNQESWFGPRSPDHILFGLSPIDNRLPALSEGPLWPNLLRYYEPERLIGPLLSLRRRKIVLQEILGKTTRKTVLLNAPFEISESPSFMSITMKPTLMGRLVAFLFKPPQVAIHFEFQSGRKMDYRLIPAIAQKGFIASPEVTSAEDFFVLANGDNSGFGPGQRPQKATVSVSDRGSWLYQKDIEIVEQPIDINPLRMARKPDAELERLLQRRRDLATIMNAVNEEPPFLRLVPEGILAHAPRTLSIPIHSPNAITITFGVQDDAWKIGHTSGACFSVLGNQDARLWSRCLDPSNTVDDRGLQTATINVPAKTVGIKLETRCRTTCSWGWSYWAGLKEEPLAVP